MSPGGRLSGTFGFTPLAAAGVRFAAAAPLAGAGVRLAGAAPPAPVVAPEADPEEPELDPQPARAIAAIERSAGALSVDIGPPVDGRLIRRLTLGTAVHRQVRAGQRQVKLRVFA